MLPSERYKICLLIVRLFSHVWFSLTLSAFCEIDYGQHVNLTLNTLVVKCRDFIVKIDK